MTRFALLVPLISVLAFSPSSGAEEEIVPYAKALSGSDVEVELVYFAAKHRSDMQDAVIKFKGPLAYGEGIDGKAHRYAADQYSGKTHYFSLKDGRRRLIVTKDFNGGDRYEAVIGKKTVGLWQDEKKSKELKASELVKELQGQ